VVRQNIDGRKASKEIEGEKIGRLVVIGFGFRANLERSGKEAA
jgi:hypothetical protein